MKSGFNRNGETKKKMLPVPEIQYYNLCPTSLSRKTGSLVFLTHSSLCLQRNKIFHYSKNEELFWFAFFKVTQTVLENRNWEADEKE